MPSLLIPCAYWKIPDLVIKRELGRAVSRLNQLLRDKRLHSAGTWSLGQRQSRSGRACHLRRYLQYQSLWWKSASPDDGDRPELSLGTHFFNDLVESGIVALALWPDEKHSASTGLFSVTLPTVWQAVAPDDADLAPYLRVIDIRGCVRRSFDALVHGWRGRKGGGISWANG